MSKYPNSPEDLGSTAFELLKLYGMNNGYKPVFIEVNSGNTYMRLPLDTVSDYDLADQLISDLLHYDRQITHEKNLQNYKK